jgi:hypothetical protein
MTGMLYPIMFAEGHTILYRELAWFCIAAPLFWRQLCAAGQRLGKTGVVPFSGLYPQSPLPVDGRAQIQ